MKIKANIGIVIPAAGSSSRMGKPKQLLPWKETTLLGNCISIAQSISENVLLVTGAYRNEIEMEAGKFKIDTVYNANWKAGLGKSIAVGVSQLVENYQDVEGILILLPDQPFVATEHLKAMLRGFSENKSSILATQYDSMRYGVPVLFPIKYFKALKTLTRNNGAKSILKENADNVISIVPKFKLSDIDTKEDYKNLLK